MLYKLLILFRYLLTLKKYVRNRSRLEGSIAEEYIADECMTFCSRYLNGVENRFKARNLLDDELDVAEGFSIFSHQGHAIGKKIFTTLDPTLLKQAHRYVLSNCDVVTPYIEYLYSFIYFI